MTDPLTWGIPDSLSTLRPAGEADYRQVELEIRKERAVWAGHLRSARQETKLVLERTGFRELRGNARRESVDGRPLLPGRASSSRAWSPRRPSCARWLGSARSCAACSTSG